MKKIILMIVLAFAFIFLNAQNKKVLLEEFSTAPCGFCPEGGIIAEQLIEKYPDLYTFTHHAGFGTDSMTIEESKIIAAKYTTFAPAAVIDRGYYPIPIYTMEGYIGISRQKWDSVCAERLNEATEANISFSDFDFNESTRTLNLKLNISFSTQIGNNDYRVNLAIVEDSVSGIGHGWDQRNYFNNDPNYPDLYHKGDTIVGYIHRHVLRSLPTGTWGDNSIIPNNPIINETYSYSLQNFIIPDRWKIKNIRLYAFITIYNDTVYYHKTLNTTEKKLIETGTIASERNNPENEFIIKPNPVTELGYIECYTIPSLNCKFELFNSKGIKIRDIYNSNKLNLSNVYFYTSDLSSGFYFIKITFGKETIIKSFVVF